MNDESVCRTAPATPGLLTRQGISNCRLCSESDVPPDLLPVESLEEPKEDLISHTPWGRATYKILKIKSSCLIFFSIETSLNFAVSKNQIAPYFGVQNILV